jgi:thiol-disulfide isomerase/thioredoxin
MKNFRIYIALAVLGILFSFAPAKKETANTVLEKVSAKLTKTKYLSYHHKRVITNPDINDDSSFEGEVHLDYRTTSSLLDCRFQFQDSNYLRVYNGAELFTLDKVSRTLLLETRKKTLINNSSFLNNSVYSLTKALPGIIADENIIKTLEDTIVDNTPLIKVSFVIRDGVIDNFGLMPVEKGYEFRYQLLVDKKNKLPAMLIRQDNHSKYTIKVSYTQFKELDNKADQSWYYSTYQPEYKLITEEKLTLVQAGTAVEDWTLPLYGAGKNVSFKNDYKGKLVLMEFWIRNCGYCISAVSTLNDMQNVYGKEKLAIIGVNTTDSESQIGEYIKRNKVSYPVVLKGDSLRRKMGVGAYPMVVLVGPDQKVLYAGYLDKPKLEKVINDNI